MTSEKLTFAKVFEIYLNYSEAFSQYNQLDDEDKKIIKPYIDFLKEQWKEELRCVCRQLENPLRGVKILAK